MTFTSKYTSVEDIPKVVSAARDAFNSGITLDVEWRKRQLHGLMQMVKQNEHEMALACKACFGKRPLSEIKMTSLNQLKSEIAHALNNIDYWVKPQSVSGGMAFMTDSLQLRPRPLGVALIMGAWNFPWNVTLVPLIGAIASGCTAIVKPSEVHEPVQDLMATLLPKYLDKNCFYVIKGAVPESTVLLKQRFDFIFYTGNTDVGKIVMRAATENLTPVLLELGGKNPVILDDTCDLGMAARRICQGRFGFNAGQACIAPEYILTDEKTAESLVGNLKEALLEFFGDNPKESKSYGSIVNERHFKRIEVLLEENRDKIVIGGEKDSGSKYIAPTVILNPSDDSALMQNEVFGPILTVKTLPNFSRMACVDYITERPKPLACYIFSSDMSFVDYCEERIDAGAVMQNDTCMQFFAPLPFGGVGASGLGGYHGKASFDAFTHNKPVILKSSRMELLNKTVRYPPYTEGKRTAMELLTQERVHSTTYSYVKKLFGVLSAGGVVAAIRGKL